VTLPDSGLAWKSRPMMMLPPPSVPFASTVAPMRVVLIRPDWAIVPPKPAPPFCRRTENDQPASIGIGLNRGCSIEDGITSDVNLAGLRIENNLGGACC
jgi:hypothetical protein